MTVEPATDIRRYVPAAETPTTVMSCLQTSIPMSAGIGASAAPSRGPVLRVRSASSEQTFVAGRDVVVGRDPQADVRIVSPLVSRAHLLLHFGGDGRWTAIDNGSLNGMFVNGRRVPNVIIADGQVINIGEPDGPSLTITLDQDSSATQQFVAPPATPRRVSAPRRPTAPGTITVGRTPDDDVVVGDVLASRHHATVAPTNDGMEIRDAGTLNGTFVNGVRVETSPLYEGDMVTIGNVDLVFTGGTLVGRSQMDTTTRTGGLLVQGATLTIEQGRVLLDNIAFSVPGRESRPWRS